MARLRLFSVCVCSLMLGALSVWGQSTGSITGVVKDKTGGVIEGARVSLFRQDGTEPEYQTLTDKAGAFSVASVSPLTYRLVIEKQGFGAYESSTVKVSPGVEQPISGIELVVGATAPTVVDVPEVGGVQTSNGEITTTLSAEQIERLPLAQRNPLDLILTQAGISNNGILTTIDGLRVPYNNFSLDSVSVQDNFIRSNGLNYTPNRLTMSQVNEFTIVTSNGSSTYGNGATQIALASPTGGNQFHGSLYYYNSNSLTNANAWFDNFNGRNSHFKQNQGGGTLSGPIKKNKLLFFTNYEFLRTGVDESQTAIAPTQAIRNGNLTYTSTAGGNYTVNALQLAGLTADPLVQGNLKGLPSPNGTTNQFLGLGNYAFNNVTKTNRDNLLARLDYLLSAKQTISATYAWNQERLDRAGLGVDILGARPGFYNDDAPNFLSLSWRSGFTPTLTNEARFGFDLAPVSFNNRNLTVPYVIDYNGANDFYGLGLGFRDYNTEFNFVNRNFSPEGRRTNTYSAQDNVSWVKGRHNVQFGFQTQLIRVASRLENQFPTVYLGTAQFLTSASSYPAPISADDQFDVNQLAAILSGRIVGYTKTFNVTSRTSGYVPGADQSRHYIYDDYALYIQDHWKPIQRLTITAGLRYELYPVMRERDGLLLTPQLNGNAVQTIYSPLAKFVFTQGDGGQALYHSDRNNFAPNVSLAYDPMGLGKTVFRAAYSISYINDDTIAAIQNTLSSNFGLAVSNFKIVDTGATLSQASAGLLAGQSPVTTPVYPATFGLSNRCPAPYTANACGQPISIVDPNLRTPYVQQWSAGIQQMLGRFLFDARYVGNHATKMLREANLGEEGATNPAAGDTTMLGNFSNSTYNGLQVGVMRRLAAGFGFQANYTYSRVMSDSARTSGSATEFYRDTRNGAADRARSPFDLTHSFKANFIYDLPFGKGRHFDNRFNAALGGWSVSGIVIAQSGAPFSVLCNFCSTYSGGTNTANVVVSPDFVTGFRMTGNGPSVIAKSAINPVNGTGVGGFTNQVFTAPADNTLGNLRYRAFTGPNFYNVDVGLHKRIKLTERQNVELRGEAFNLFNHPNFFARDEFIDLSGFGRNITTLGTPRQLQFAVYYRF
jgi:hypothetical protein